MNFDDQPDYLPICIMSGLCGYVATMLPLAEPIQIGCGIVAAYLTSFAYLKLIGWW